MKAIVNKDTCIGCGACQAICPEIFNFDDEGIMEAKDSCIEDKYIDDVLDAKDGCPVDAIDITKDE